MSALPSPWAEASDSEPSVFDSGAFTRSRPARANDAIEPSASSGPAEFPFTLSDLGKLRKFVAAAATGAALEQQRCEDLVLAVDELATNSVCHGGGSGSLHIWREPGELVCEVRDRGFIDEPVHGRAQPDPDAVSGRGLWLVEQLTDCVEVTSAPREGSVVRVRMQLA